MVKTLTVTIVTFVCLPGLLFAQSHGLGADAGAELHRLHRISDAITAFSYFGIAATLTYLVYRLRQQLPFGQVFLLFGAFIVLCGATHLNSVLLLGNSAPRLVVVISVATAVVSLLTAVLLPSYIPKVIAFAASAEAARERDVAKARASALEEVNEQLMEQAIALEETNTLLADSLLARAAIEEQFQATFEQAAVGIAHLSLDGRWLRVNRCLCDILGCEAQGLLAGTHDSITHPEDRAADLHQLQQLMNGDRNDFSREKRFLHADGEPVWVHVSVTLVRDHAQEPAYFIAVVEDIRARKAAELELLNANRRKDHFLAILSHELRNPLAPIRSGVELLQQISQNRNAAGLVASDIAGDGITAARVLPIMQRQVAHMTRLLDDLLDASRLDHDKVELHLQSVDAVEVVRHTGDTMRQMVEERGLTLVTTVADAPLMIVADPVRLTQMLSNLLDNAAKFSERGGRVDLSVQQEADEVVIAVRDTGIGLAPEHLTQVFEAFAQIESALSRSYGGLGIGLSLVRAFAERQGASAHATSDGLGHGSEFSLRFPVAPQPSLPEERAVAEPQSLSANAEPMRVLVVDDSYDASNTMAALVATTGREVRAVQDGSSALRVVSEFRPDAVLLDLGMPDMDGFETCRRIRAIEGGEATLIIALTGWGRDEDRQRTREAGFDYHLVKPVDRAAIVRALESGSDARSTTKS